MCTQTSAPPVKVGRPPMFCHIVLTFNESCPVRVRHAKIFEYDRHDYNRFYAREMNGERYFDSRSFDMLGIKYSAYAPPIGAHVRVSIGDSLKSGRVSKSILTRGRPLPHFLITLDESKAIVDSKVLTEMDFHIEICDPDASNKSISRMIDTTDEAGSDITAIHQRAPKKLKTSPSVTDSTLESRPSNNVPTRNNAASNSKSTQTQTETKPRNHLDDAPLRDVTSRRGASSR